jgi:hypothetical protein
MTQRVLFQRIDEPGAESCRFEPRQDGHSVGGLIVVALENVPADVDYLVTLDEHWVTQHVSVTQRIGRRIDTVSIVVRNGSWTVDGVDAPALEGCIDVDVALTPATNTLPIRRLALQVGESAYVDAAWLRFPSLSLERLSQRYTRIGANQYRYESGAAFIATLEVDDWGIVRKYSDLWLATTVTKSD